MSKKQIEPIHKNRVMDLLKIAGVNVNDWKYFKGGEKKAASNPKYCYNWAFVEPKMVIVLNLWYSKIKELNGELFQEINMREDAKYFAQFPGKSVWSKRALEMDDAIQTAITDNLEVRVIICDGNILRERNRTAKASQVNKRMLDPVSWTIKNYNRQNGDCILIRGEQKNTIVDQFTLENEESDLPKKKEVKTSVYERDSKVRKNVLIRSKGYCEFCGNVGFTMKDDRLYLETHHIIPLAENGSDVESNVVALCPNHHREAHHGLIQKEIREKLIQKIKLFYQYSM